MKYERVFVLPHLDLFTVRVMTVISVFIASLATLFAGRINSTVAGMRLFALGLLSLCAGSALALTATVSPASAMVIAATVFRIGGMISVLQGVRKFRGFPVLSGASVAAIASGFLVVFLVFRRGQFWHARGSDIFRIVSPRFRRLLLHALADYPRGNAFCTGRRGSHSRLPRRT